MMNKYLDKFKGWVSYFLDLFKSKTLLVTVEEFTLNENARITVVYRLGGKRALNKLHVFDFERTFYGELSNFDQHRLTKYAVIQKIIDVCFMNEKCAKNYFLNFVENELKNDKLF